VQERFAKTVTNKLPLLSVLAVAPFISVLSNEYLIKFGFPFFKAIVKIDINVLVINSFKIEFITKIFI